MVRIGVGPIESRGSCRVNEMAWSEKVYRVVSAESGEMEARFGLEGWPEKVVHRDLRKVPENSAPEPWGLEVQSRLYSTFLLYISRQLRPPLTDKLLRVRSGRGLGRAPMI